MPPEPISVTSSSSGVVAGLGWAGISSEMSVGLVLSLEFGVALWKDIGSHIHVFLRLRLGISVAASFTERKCH